MLAWVFPDAAVGATTIAVEMKRVVRLRTIEVITHLLAKSILTESDLLALSSRRNARQMQS
jgi:hypothetical protein